MNYINLLCITLLVWVSSGEYGDYELLPGPFIFDGAASWCVAYDPLNDGFALINGFASDESYVAEIHEITSESVLDDDPDSFDYNKMDNLRSTEHENAGNGDNQVPFYQGLKVVDGYFYAMDSHGSISKIDADKNVVGSVTLFEYSESAMLTGMCVDEASMMLYAVSAAREQIYSVDLQQFTEGVLLYDGEEVKDTERSNPRIYKPKDCTVVGGNLFLVESKDYDENVQSFGLYDTRSGKLRYIPGLFDESAVSIESYKGNVVILGSDVALYVAEAPSSGQAGPEGEQQTLDIAFEKVVQVAGAESTAFDLAIDYKNGIFAVDTYDGNAGKNTFLFVTSSDLFQQERVRGGGAERGGGGGGGRNAGAGGQAGGARGGGGGRNGPRSSAGAGLYELPSYEQYKPYQPLPAFPGHSYQPQQGVSNTVLLLSILNIFCVIFGLCVCWRNGMFEDYKN